MTRTPSRPLSRSRSRLAARASAVLAAGFLTIPLLPGSTQAQPAAESATQPGTRSDTATSGPDLCATRGPIRVADLAGGFVAGSECSLVGRQVVAGGASVTVPPAGYGAGGHGLAGGSASTVPELQVTNFGGVVRAATDGSLSTAGSKSAPVQARAADAGACQATAYSFPDGRHPWRTTLRWNYQLGSTPDRFGDPYRALKQIRAGNGNMVGAHNDCGLRGDPRVTTRYVGKTRGAPNIYVSGTSVRCGKYNPFNVVGWGGLPGGLIGWTCYWWSSGGAMVGGDMRIATSRRVVLGYGRNCSNRFDLQSLATHEWGHMLGLGHVSNRNLTMHHFLPECSYRFRTLGRGDYLGLRALYGLRF